MVKTVLKIDGMMCSMCESHINDIVRRNFNVKKVASSHKKGTAEIISDDPPDTAALEKAIGGTGYKLVSVQSSPYVKRSLFGR